MADTGTFEAEMHEPAIVAAPRQIAVNPPAEHRDAAPGLRPITVTNACLLVLTVITLGATAYIARAYFTPILTAFVFAVMLAPLCNRLEKLKLPRALAALGAMALLGCVIYAGFSFVARPAAHFVDDAPKMIDKAGKQLKTLRAPLKSVTDLSDQVNDLAIAPPAPNTPRTVVLQGPGLVDSLIASAQVILLQAAFTVVLTLLFLLTRDEMRLKLIAFQPRMASRVRTARVFRDVEKRVSGYMMTVALINMGVGVAVGVACWQLGMPEPAMWGGLAALLNFVPFVGPAITVGAIGLVGLATFPTILQAAYPVLAYFAIAAVESNLVTPLVMSRRMTLNPLAIMLAVSFWTWLWGPIGALISIPLLIMLKVVADHAPPLWGLAALIGGPIPKPRALRAAEAARVAGEALSTKHSVVAT